MLWTIIGGFAFLGCQAWEWSHFISGTDIPTLGDVLVNGVWVENYEILGLILLLINMGHQCSLHCFSLLLVFTVFTFSQGCTQCYYFL